MIVSLLPTQTNANTRTLIHQLSAEYGLTPIEIVVRELMRRVHILLVETDMTIAAVAQTVSYGSVSSLSHLFKKLRQVAGKMPSRHPNRHLNTRCLLPLD